MCKEHEAEKRHLQNQIELEKSLVKLTKSNLEGKMEELKSHVKELQSMKQQFEGKKQQVLELRKRLHQSEEELKVMRGNMVKQNKKVSKLVPSLPTGLGQGKVWREVEETRAYLDSMTPTCPMRTL